MAARRPQTIVKRQREQALREKRERKQAKKDARAAEKLAIANGELPEPTEGDDSGDDAEAGSASVTADDPVEPAPG